MMTRRRRTEQNRAASAFPSAEARLFSGLRGYGKGGERGGAFPAAILTLFADAQARGDELCVESGRGEGRDVGPLLPLGPMLWRVVSAVESEGRSSRCSVGHASCQFDGRPRSPHLFQRWRRPVAQKPCKAGVRGRNQQQPPR